MRIGRKEDVQCWTAVNLLQKFVHGKIYSIQIIMFDLFKVLEQQLNGFGNGTYFETVFIDNK